MKDKAKANKKLEKIRKASELKKKLGKGNKLEELRKEFKEKGIKGSVQAREYVDRRIKMMDEEELKKYSSRREFCKDLLEEMKQFTPEHKKRPPIAEQSLSSYLKNHERKRTEIGKKSKLTKNKSGYFY